MLSQGVDLRKKNNKVKALLTQRDESTTKQTMIHCENYGRRFENSDTFTTPLKHRKYPTIPSAKSRQSQCYARWCKEKREEERKRKQFGSVADA